MRLAPSLPTVLALAAVAAACGAGEGSKLFGEQTEPCAPIVLTNDDTDAAAISTGTECVLAEIDAGRPVTWDVLALTVEGDPIPTRYAFDGDEITITRDDTRDEFGTGGVTVERCDGIRRGTWLPEGTGCSPAGGDGFRDESLPTG